MGNRKILEYLANLFDDWSKRKLPFSPDLAKGVLTAGAISKGQTALDLLVRRFEKTRVEHERMTIAGALGSLGQWPVLEQALAYALEKIPDRIRFMPLVSSAGKPGRAVIDSGAGSRKKRLSWQHMHPLLLERVGRGDDSRSRPYGSEPHPELLPWSRGKSKPRLKDVIALSLERLSVNIGWRERNEK